MPHCYSLLVSIASSRDPQTQNWNVLGLVESIQTRRVPIDLPLHIHAFWSFAPEEVGKQFETRIALAFNTTDLEPSEPLALSSITPYAHLRLRGLVIERAGAYRLQIEWRSIGETQWRREVAFWPFMVSLSSE